ncbi:L-arabinose transport system permease protein AraQ [compost metagenome]
MSGRRRFSSKWMVNGVLLIICLVWIIPTLGLFISSFRLADDIKRSGWWDVFPHRAWTETRTIALPEDTNLRSPITLEGVETTDRELRQGITLGDGQRAVWKDRGDRTVSVLEQRWTVNWKFTIDNYLDVLQDKGQSSSGQRISGLSKAFVNTLTVSIPATVIPIFIGIVAAYGFSWMTFPFKRILFGIVIALLVVPLQVSLIPILNDFLKLGINGTILSIWIAHTGFGLPLSIYFMYNYVSQLPRDLFESADIDGASHFTAFRQIVLPLSVPALASFGIFQFLWVWNDYLVSLIFLGSRPDNKVLSIYLSEMSGPYGNEWHLLTSSAFISILVPLLVFFLLQRYFVRGLMGGAVKG